MIPHDVPVLTLYNYTMWLAWCCMIKDVCGTYSFWFFSFFLNFFENKKTLRISLNLEKPPDFIKHIKAH